MFARDKLTLRPDDPRVQYHVALLRSLYQRLNNHKKAVALFEDHLKVLREKKSEDDAETIRPPIYLFSWVGVTMGGAL